MSQVLKKQWFLVALVILIVGGLFIGSSVDAAAVGAIKRLIPPRAITVIVLLLMAFSLDSAHLKTSLRSPKPVLWASLVNLALIPALGWALVPLQWTDDFEIGLMIAASVPCTLAAASVWTRKAGGNDAISLLVTLLTNGICFLVTPFWLSLATRNITELPAREMILDLIVAVLLPTALGQGARQIPRLGEFANRHKFSIGVAAQCFILSMVLGAALDAGSRLQETRASATILGVLVVWGSVIGLHLVALGVAYVGAKRFGFSVGDCAAVAFAASQKTLPVGVLIATSKTMFGNPDLLGPGMGVPFAVFPMLMYHASQLFIDTAVAERLAATRGDAKAE
jgi:sodium/bile acid cotransporter 7